MVRIINLTQNNLNGYSLDNEHKNIEESATLKKKRGA